ncbi:MAG: phosphopantetheine-binding protein [Clostridiales bacterium]|nr:phosphopantetheine-binding protein [Clostridiales bacterium]
MRKLFTLWCEVLEVSYDINQLTEDEFSELISSQLDSIDTIKFLISVEETYNIAFDDDMLVLDSEQLFNAVARYIEQK